jgi:hypothetical protein
VLNTAMIRRAAIVGAGGWDEKTRHCEDFDLWLRIAVQEGRFERHSRIIARYRLRGDSQSAAVGKMYEGRMYAYRKLLDNSALPPALVPLLQQRIATTSGDIALARGKEAFRGQNFALAGRCLAEASRHRGSIRLWALSMLLKTFPKLLYGLSRLRARLFARHKDA